MLVRVTLLWFPREEEAESLDLKEWRSHLCSLFLVDMGRKIRSPNLMKKSILRKIEPANR